MGSQPWAADWEHIVGRDLVPHLLPPGGHTNVHRPLDVTRLPGDAFMALSGAAGNTGIEDLLVIPAAAWQWDRWQRRSLYTPLSVAAVGEHAAALWVQALPVPGMRVELPLSDIAAVEQRRDGPWRVLAVTGRAGQLPVRYHEDGEAAVNAWARRLRFRAAPVTEPLPESRPAGPVPGTTGGMDSFLLASGDQIAWTSWHEGRQRCVLAVTSRELIIAESPRQPGLPGRRTARTLYLPRRCIEHALIRSGTMRVRSAGVEVRVGFRAGKAAARASAWLSHVLGGDDRSSTGCWPGPIGGM